MHTYAHMYAHAHMHACTRTHARMHRQWKETQPLPQIAFLSVVPWLMEAELPFRIPLRL